MLRSRYAKWSYLLSRTFDTHCRLNWYRQISTVNVRQRLLIWEAEKKRQEDRLNVKTQNTINITLIDGTVKQGIAGVTTPLEFAKGELDIGLPIFTM